MHFLLGNPIMLFGMFALAIPIIIHLLNRRRFEVVDWGAMRFLQISETTRRRVFIEELLLMLLRMGLIAILVLAMCGPRVFSVVFEKMGLIENRDIVFVFDGSTAMTYTDDDGTTAHEQAVAWARTAIDKLTPGDTVTILQAREQPVQYLDATSDLDKAREMLDKLAAPAGNCDWPAAVEAAHDSLQSSHRSRREVLLLGVGRKSGWADPATLKRWEDLAPQLADGKSTMRIWMVPFAEKRPVELPNWSLTRVEAGSVGSSTALTFRSSLRIQGKEKYEPPYRLYYEIDQSPTEPRYRLTDKSLAALKNATVPNEVLGKLDPLKGKDFVTEEQFWAKLAKLLTEDELKHFQDRVLDQARIDVHALGADITLPKSDDLKDGRLPLTFAHRLPGPGSHLVSVIVQPDAPKYRLTPGSSTVRRDRLAGDNRRDLAIMVPLLPVLIVDGLPPLPEERQGGDFLLAALHPFHANVTDTEKALTEREAEAKSRLMRAKIEPLAELEAALKRDIGPEPNTRPRVLVLCDVPELTPKQQEAVEAFVKEGGGLLVTVGPRAKAAHYNGELFQTGRGFLPARLEKQVGDENELVPVKPDEPDRAAHPLPGSFLHPALNLFREPPYTEIERARFPKWWQLALPPGDTKPLVADLVIPGDKRGDKKPERTPWLVEKKFGKGTVILCSVPLDDSWGTNFPTGAVPMYPVLVNNLIAYLAGSFVTEYSVEPGQPLVCPLLDDERGAPTKTVLKTPRGDSISLEEKDGVVTHKDTRLSGVYVLTTPRNRTVYFVVKAAEVGDSDDMTAWTDDGKKEVKEVFRRGGMAANPSRAAEVLLDYPDDVAEILSGKKHDLWWLFLVGVTLLLCSEVWMTRRIAKGR